MTPFRQLKRHRWLYQERIQSSDSDREEQELQMRKAIVRAERNGATELAVAVLGGKWKLMILDPLAEDTRRLDQLQRLIPAAAEGSAGSPWSGLGLDSAAGTSEPL